MNRFIVVCVPAALAALAGAAHAGTFTLTPVTNTTPNFAGTILIQGVVSAGPGESFLSPNVMSTVNLPFLAGFTAGFNGSGQTFDPAFLAWNGLGTYTGPIYDHQISTNNAGYACGMPLGLYGSNPFGPAGMSSIVLHYTSVTGQTQSVSANYAVNVIPAPGAMAVLGLGGLLVARRRR